MSLTVNDIAALMNRHGAVMYGSEAISQLQHALQCAHLAELAGESPATVVASLLHDLGHLIHLEKAQLSAEQAQQAPETDDVHEYVALPFLRPLFGDAVCEPIRLHVQAKRYLCATESSYWDTLSAASQHSLELQGGIFSPAEVSRFATLAFSGESVRLRRYDDLAKVTGAVTPDWQHYEALMQQVAN